MKKIFKNKWTWIAGGGLLLILAFYFGQTLMSGQGQVTTDGTTQTTTAFLGDLDATASASGQVRALRKVSLGMQISGTVAEVPVMIGDTIAEGDILIRLDQGSLERAVLDAEQALLIQEQQLAQLVAPPTAVDLAAAEANLASAQTRLDSLLAGPTAEEISASEASLRAAQSDVAAAAARLQSANSGGNSDELLVARKAMDDAQKAYTQAEEAHRASYNCTWNDQTASFDCVGDTEKEKAARVPAQQAYAELLAAQERVANLQPGGNETGIASAQASLTSAVARRDAAQARLDMLLTGSTEAEIASARASVAQAQTQLDTLRDGPDDEQIIRQEALVEQARIGLARAANNLERATLRAPFDGIVTQVNVSPGETSSGILIELIDTSSLEVVLEVDEVDIGLIEIGQPAAISFESLPGQEISGQVAAVAPENTPNSAGTIVYEVSLSFAQSDLPIREGMTADSQLVTAQRQDVLLLPNAAIKANRAEGTFSVDVVKGSNDDGMLIIENIPITIGLRDNQFTQISGGLDAGTEVAIGYNPPPRQGFGPGGGGPPDFGG